MRGGGCRQGIRWPAGAPPTTSLPQARRFLFRRSTWSRDGVHDDNSRHRDFQAARGRTGLHGPLTFLRQRARMETYRLQARRWPYALLAAAFALVALFFVEVLPHGRRDDPSFYVINGGFLLASGYMAFSLALKSALVPRIAMRPEGLSLRVGMKLRFLKWSQISEVALKRTQRGSFAAVYWQQAEGRPLKGLWLNYPFPIEGEAIFERLEGSLGRRKSKGRIPSLRAAAIQHRRRPGSPACCDCSDGPPSPRR